MFSILSISLLILGIAAGPLYCYFLIRNKKVWSVILLILLFALGLGLSVLIFFSTGTFFVAATTCLLFPIALITTLIMVFWRRKQLDQLASNRSLRRWYLAGVILVPLILILPFFELFGIQMGCFRLNRRAAQPIITALDEYQRDNEKYPEVLDDLVPKYLDLVPHGSCSPHSRPEYEPLEFEIQVCSNEDVPILTIPIGTGEWIQRYNLETGDWARISFLDGACSYLK